MAETTTLTIRMGVETKARLDKLARRYGRSKSYLALQALDRYLGDEDLITRRIRKGLQAAEEEDFASDDEMEALFRKWGA